MKQFWSKYVRLVRILSFLGMVLGAVFVVLMMILITVEVLIRNTINVSTIISDEYTGYFMCAASFFGAAYTIQKDGFIRIKFLREWLSPRWAAATEILSYVLTIVFMGILIQYLCLFVAESFRLGTASNFITLTPLYIPQSAMIIGSVVFFLQIIVGFSQAIGRFIGKGSDRQIREFNSQSSHTSVKSFE